MDSINEQSAAQGGSQQDRGPTTTIEPEAKRVRDTEEKSPDTVILEGNQEVAYENEIFYLDGLRFWGACMLLSIMFFLVSMEISVVTTAMVGISKELGEFDSVSWILSSYLLGYVAVVIIFAKFSDIFGRRQILVTCIFIFTVFSGACGAAQTMTQLIILRAFQGMGGGGSFAMNMIFLIEMVPASKYAQLVANMGFPSAIALGLGPVIGGGITSNTTWRWVFLMNVPIGASAIALAFLAIPRTFPYSEHSSTSLHWSSLRAFDRVDILGSGLLLLATLAVTAGFEEADSLFPWKSAYVISLLTIGGLLWILFSFWERHVTLAKSNREAVLPWRFFSERALVGILLGEVMLGGPMTVTVFQLPQRFQIINGLSSVDAGVRLVPFGVTVPIGAMLGSRIAGNLRVPPIFVAIGGAILQVVGFALLSQLPSTTQIPPSVYGFQVLCGIGVGATYQSLYILVPLIVGIKDQAVGMGAATQFRMMGGAIVLALSTSVFNSHVLPALDELGLSGSSRNLPQTIALIEKTDVLASLRSSLSEGYNRQMYVLCASAAAQALAALLVLKRKQWILPEQ
ncbi:unnamed protein product [Clonostachys rhizophaga]|uniref:Major facilitator superfamily (MFS) profile domain-containing protein n=1 Tax=Clonostachys rhizophaga TaxID=160324 RepID=A0A9N9VW40_9HYPO|nr:unnamed protein product [Clonostachys rhizophaga]